MPHVYFNYDEIILEYSNQFINSSKQVQELLNQVQIAVNTLQGVPWEGESASRFYSDWKAVSPQIGKSIETLNQAGKMLKQLADNCFGIDRNL